MKVLLILIDGLCADALRQAHTPAIDKILQKGTSSLQCQTVFPAVTLPAHVSLFTSRDPANHGILDNDALYQLPPVTLFDLAAHANRSTASFYTWENLRIISRPGSLDYSCFMKRNQTPEGDHMIMEAAIQHIQSEEPDFTFVYLGCTDEVGHDQGFMSSPYLQQIERTDQAIANLITFLESSSRENEYTYLVTSDHGGHDNTHHGTFPGDFTIPWMIVGPSIRKNYTINSPLSILDTAPTLARIMGLPALDFWEGEVKEEIFSDALLPNSSCPAKVKCGKSDYQVCC